MHCIGCGDDISKIPSIRRSLRSDSVGDPDKSRPSVHGFLCSVSNCSCKGSPSVTLQLIRRIQGECASLVLHTLGTIKNF